MDERAEDGSSSGVDGKDIALRSFLESECPKKLPRVGLRLLSLRDK